MRTIFQSIAGITGTILLLFSFSIPVQAHYVVTKTADTADGFCDESDCSLREAVIAANSEQPGSDFINLPPGTYFLTRTGAGEDNAITGDLDIFHQNLTISGAGADKTIIDATPLNDRIFDTPQGGINLTVQNLTLQGGNAGNGGGGAILFTTSTNNTLTLLNCVIDRNLAAAGGGLMAEGTVIIDNTTIDDNTSLGSGGGILASAAKVSVNNSTISGNKAADGGGISDTSLGLTTYSIKNTTITLNQASSQGGGLFGNTNTKIDLTSTILAANKANSGPDCGGPVDSSGFNIIGDGTGCILTSGTGDKIGNPGAVIDPKLAPLGTYGGPTPTHALLQGSPAIDLGNSDEGGCTDSGNNLLAFDQRNFPRVMDGNNDGKAACDIGAYERGTCGDGFKEPDETCDDGNTQNGDGCSSTCTSETINPNENSNSAGSCALSPTNIKKRPLSQISLYLLMTLFLGLFRMPGIKREKKS